MSLQIICGSLGANKSHYCKEQIKKLISQNQEVLYIIPEQISFETERSLFGKLNFKFTNNLNIVSFSRLANNIFSKYGPLNSQNLNDSIKIVILKRAILLSNKLKLIPKDTILEPLLQCVEQLKRSNLDFNSLNSLKNKLSKFDDLNNLVSDIQAIYFNYESLIQKYTATPANDMNIAIERLAKFKPFLNHTIFIDSFDDFSAQEFEFVKTLMRDSKKVVVTLNIDNKIDSAESYEDHMDVFSIQRRVRYHLMDYANDEGIEIEEYLFLESPNRFENDELKFLESNFFKYNAEPYYEKPENIKILIGNDKFKEVDLVANQIINICRDDGYRYKDIVILTTDTSNYLPIIKEIFKRYSIPYFFNEQQNILSFSLTQTIIYICEIIINRFQLKDILNYAKLGYLDVSHKEICEFENYCLAVGINSNSWFHNTDFTYMPKYLNYFDLESLNSTKKKILDPLIDFYKHISTEANNQLLQISKITVSLYELVLNLGILKKVECKIKSFLSDGEIEKARLEKQIWESMVNSFEVLNNHLSEEKASLREYFQLIETVFRTQKISEIPPTCDQVIIGTIGNFKNIDTKCTIILGANDGVFPNTNSESSYINDKNKDILISAGLNIPYSKYDSVIRNEFLCYQALTSSKNKLYMSYSLTNSDGSELTESIVVKRVKHIFPNIKITNNKSSDSINLNDKNIILKTLVCQISDLIFRNNSSSNLEFELSAGWIAIQKWIAENFEWNNKYQKALNYLTYSNDPQKLSLEQVNSIYFDTSKHDEKKINVSVTKLEKFASCSFAYYLQYGLNIHPREAPEPNALNIGTILHEIVYRVLEEFRILNVWNQDMNHIDNLITKRLPEVTHDVLNQFLTPEILKSPRFFRLNTKIIRVLTLTIRSAAKFYITTRIRPFAYEYKFSRDIANSNIRLVGKIDRIDVMSTPKKDYLFTVDYKSGSKLLDYSDFYYGVKMQLPVYGMIFKSIYDSKVKTGKESIIAGLLYKKFDNVQIDVAKQLTRKVNIDYEIDKKIEELTKMAGMVFTEAISPENSCFMKASAASHLLNSNEMKLLIKHSKDKVMQLVGALTSGNININPVIVKRSQMRAFGACDYCNYQDICRYEKCNISLKEKIYKEEFFNYVSQVDGNTKSSDSAS